MASKLSLCTLFDSDEFIGSNFDSQYQKLNFDLNLKLDEKSKTEQSQADFDSNRPKRNEQLIADQVFI